MASKNNQEPESHGLSRVMIICGFVTLIVFLFSGCGAFHNALIYEFDKVQFGLISWYNNQFHGRKTSSGEIYDKDEFTAAHRVLPFGTIVNVTNIKNGRSVLVKINDRGPHKRSRKLDVSYAAAKKLGMINDGIVKAKIEIVNSDYASALYEQQKETWCAFNIDAYFNDTCVVQASLPTAQSKFFKENKFDGMGFNKTAPKMYDHDGENMIIAGISK